MTRFLIATLVLASGPVGVRPQTPDRPSVPGNLLQIDAVAFDRSGRPVTDLRREELEIWVSGYRVPIETLVAVTADDQRQGGRVTLLVLDDMTVAPPLIPRVREVARRFVNRLLPGDQMAVVPLNGGSMELTDDRGRLLRSIDAYTSASIGVVRIDALGEQVLKTLAALSRQLIEVSDRRNTIVGIGSAWLFDTPIPPPGVGRDLRREWLNAMHGMSSAHANFYVIDPAGVGSSPVAGGTSGFARETGGHAFVNTNDLNAAADRIMREAGSYYLIGVVDPPVGRTADLRELDVRVLRRGVTIRARRGIPGSR